MRVNKYLMCVNNWVETRFDPKNVGGSRPVFRRGYFGTFTRHHLRDHFVATTVHPKDDVYYGSGVPRRVQTVVYIVKMV